MMHKRVYLCILPPLQKRGNRVAGFHANQVTAALDVGKEVRFHFLPTNQFNPYDKYENLYEKQATQATSESEGVYLKLFNCFQRIDTIGEGIPEKILSGDTDFFQSPCVLSRYSSHYGQALQQLTQLNLNLNQIVCYAGS